MEIYGNEKRKMTENLFQEFKNEINVIFNFNFFFFSILFFFSFQYVEKTILFIITI